MRAMAPKAAESRSGINFKKVIVASGIVAAASLLVSNTGFSGIGEPRFARAAFGRRAPSPPGPIPAQPSVRAIP